jgi:hypothetical protein
MFRFAVLLSMLVACAPTSPTAPEDGSPDAVPVENEDAVPAGLRVRGIGLIAADDSAEAQILDAEVTVRMLMKYNGDWFPAKPGTELHTGERFKFSVKLARPGCLYMLYRDAQGQAASLFPNKDETHCVPAGEYTVPDPRSQLAELILLPPAGDELVYIVVTDRPVGDADSELAARIVDMETGKNSDLPISKVEPSRDAEERKRHTRTASAGQPGYDSYSPDPRARGPQGVRNGGASVDARADNAGVVIILYPISHVD